ncbi:type IV secretory pathway TrbL component [Bradyrhizobium japonicum]|uniref:Type IV secretory pathway TrbL component n=1 Tax=Bradyrhizobium elkanii TaxID=29448 RepID=A0ABV4F964_BRAEL|nr:hypothetical protein [Bradyrhizobium elkanii]MBP2433162.1 type IV secretory pathway TrbL component [Bradyrhizobium elkanii]MCP1733518.1 type IV secretory pathway TrbL component [Bradyrhizobium elkanii]MCP1751193.1 type IV secretory pathway TrbL component [Bradyrhizobium elkanii]MCP1976965.1 type IV secretory pathway TrbL component [Bradyrhizobium elkanii]MCS3568855.1 type IV secretory pathway TrbL component [Bradyrhizobium elkanii]
MRTLILAATALAFVSSTALAQDKAGGSPAPTAQSGDTATKGEAAKAPKKAKKTAKKSSTKTGAKTGAATTGSDATKQ